MLEENYADLIYVSDTEFGVLWIASTINSPFTSSTKSGSATPTALLEQAALDLSRASIPASIPSRARSRSPKRHRRRSVTPPSAYTSGRRYLSGSCVANHNHS